MNSQHLNFRKLLPSLTLGVVITLLAALFNYVIYDRRLPARVLGNRVSGGDPVPGQLPGPGSSPLRIIAGLLNLSDDLVQTTMYAIRGTGGFDSTQNRIAVIAIDEASLVRRGAWPWPRTDIAKLMEKAAGASVVCLDILFPEGDPTSILNYVETLELYTGQNIPIDQSVRERADNDRILARQISAYRTILGAVLIDGIEPTVKPQAMKNSHVPEVVLPDGSRIPGDGVLLKQVDYLLASISTLRNVTPRPAGEGYMNLFPTSRGVVRSIPLFAHVRDDAFSVLSGQPRRVVPSVALEMMRVSMDGDGYRINLRGDRVNIPEFRDSTSNGDHYVVESVQILRDESPLITIPLNELAEMEVGFRSHRNDFTVYPAWEVLEGMHDGAFSDKIVIVGGTVEGVGYVVSSGLPDPEVTVPETHAAMLSSMLKRDFMDSGYRHDYFWQQVAILTCGLAVTAAIILGNLVGGILVAAVMLVAMVLSNYFLFFKNGLDVGMTLPVLSTLAVLLVLMGSNYLVVGRERRFIRKAFQLNVSPSILGYLENHPDRLSSLQGEHRHMTVLFSDIRSFTTMSEKLSAPDLARFLNEYFTPMSDIVMGSMGTVDKFIGDGLMAFWNAPADNPDHARDAARAALLMVEKLDELQPGWTERGLPRISIGCGINTGFMFAGYMGSEQRKNYTVMGDNVNIASRLENLNKTYQSSILITESTRKDLGNDFICRVTDKVRVSGKEEAVVIYELLGIGPASEKKVEELAAFGRVFELYQEREFATAEALLKELVFIRPAPIYKMYLDRLAIYKALPPPSDWDGTFSMTHK